MRLVATAITCAVLSFGTALLHLNWLPAPAAAETAENVPSSSAPPRVAPLLGGTAVPLTSTAIALVEFAEGSCSGVLVSPRLVLTTAHCLIDDFGVPLTKHSVVVGSVTRQVIKGYVHPFYVPWDPVLSSLPYDLGLLELSEPVTTVAPLPVLHGLPLARGAVLTVYGYGTNESSDTNISLLDDSRVASVKVSAVNDLALFTSHTSSGASICSGDSGGPAIYSVSGTLAVAGISAAGSNLDIFGRCEQGGAGDSIFVNLQSASSTAFLQRFTDIALIDGARVQLQTAVLQLAGTMTAAYYERSISRLRKKLESASSSLKRASKGADPSTMPFLWAAQAEVAAARKERKIAAARTRIVTALGYLATVLKSSAFVAGPQ